MKKKIEELFRLAMKAQEKTSAFVSFETSNHGWGCLSYALVRYKPRNQEKVRQNL